MQNNIQVMGIVNITSDSFFPGSRMIGPDGCIDFDKIRATVQQMLRSWTLEHALPDPEANPSMLKANGNALRPPYQ